MNDIYKITISLMDYEDDEGKFLEVLRPLFETEENKVIGGNFSNYLTLLGNMAVNINTEFHNVELRDFNNKCTNQEIENKKEEILKAVENQLNYRTVCLEIELDNEYKKMEFIPSGDYVSVPKWYKKNKFLKWLHKNLKSASY